MNGGTACTFEQIVDNRCYKQLVTVLFKMYKAFICIYHLFQVEWPFHDVCKGVTLIIALIESVQCLNIKVTLYDQCREDSTWKTPTIWYKIYTAGIIGLQLLDTLHNLGHVLVLERLVYAYIVISPTIMSCRRWLDSCTGAASYGINGNIALEQMFFCERQQTKLYTSGKTARVGYVTALAGVATVELG